MGNTVTNPTLSPTHGLYDLVQTAPNDWIGMSDTGKWRVIRSRASRLWWTVDPNRMYFKAHDSWERAYNYAYTKAVQQMNEVP